MVLGYRPWGQPRVPQNMDNSKIQKIASFIENLICARHSKEPGTVFEPHN